MNGAVSNIGRQDIYFDYLAKHLNAVTMKHVSIFLIALSSLLYSTASAQTAILSTNPVAEQIMLGAYNPASYLPATVIRHPDSISRGINARISPDSLHAYLEVLRNFKNRNTGSDTVASDKGIGATRRWVYSKFQEFSAQAGSRLIPSYLQFDLLICDQPRHRNIFAVLPGTDTSDKSIVIIEGHIDSRCAGLCDTACLAEGMEDNGSGTALVMELARVMSAYSFSRTIVFTTVIGEEQGLAGAKAFADYAAQKGIKIRAVMNNDVVGGIVCGHTSSPPSCPGFNAVDSTHVRLFSAGGFNSFHKGLARFVKLEYKEMLLPHVAVPMGIHIMTDEDRIGRGGDHIPLRQHGFTAIRFTSANEHGDANVANPNYADRQHTSDDILGIDMDGDLIPDSLFVNLNYLARNAVINGNAAAMAAIGPKTPDFVLSTNSQNELEVQITQQTGYPKYRIGMRTTTNDWDSVYSFSGSLTHTIALPGSNYIVSVASVDSNDVESLFSREHMTFVGVEQVTRNPYASVELLQNSPNPFDETTMISVAVHEPVSYKEAYISIADAVTGKEVKRMPISLRSGVSEVLYAHGYNAVGTYVYSLVIDGKRVQSRKMVFAN